MKKHINKHLEKSFIRPSSSATVTAVALVLLVRKPAGRLRFCVNYKTLNKILMKNQYLIPLINKILEKLSSAACFIKLDIIYAFNRV